MPEEDAVRASGHMFLTKLEWILHLVKYPDHLLVTGVAGWAEYCGVFLPDHPVYKYIVRVAEICRLL